MVFNICHYIYLGHSSVFISLQFLYQQTVQNEQFLPKHGVRLQREKEGLA